MNNHIKESKRLAYLLRHSNLPDYNGWVKVSVVLGNLGLSLQDLQQIVESDNKGRFEFSEDKSSVRALYGHTIDVNLGLEPTIPPPVLYHGTAEKYIDSIMKEGLRPRKRNFVHLSETCHYPLLDWPDKRQGAVMLHGHCHGTMDDYNANSADLRFDIGIDGALAKQAGGFIDIKTLYEAILKKTGGLTPQQYENENY